MQNEDFKATPAAVQTGSESSEAPMGTGNNDPGKTPEAMPLYGSGSIAHQIIGQFIAELGENEGFVSIAKRLEAVVYSGKPTELELKTALFGEIEL